MLTLNECRKLVDPKKEKYTDKQLLKMRDLLTDMLSDIINELKTKQNEASSVNGQSVQ